MSNLPPPLPERLAALPDIHTHNAEAAEHALLSLNPEDAAAYSAAYPGRMFSAGIHPWEPYESDAKEDERFAALRRSLRLEGAAAVGETGFDKLRGPSMEIQERRFRRHAELSEEFGVPLIIHLVKAQERLLALRAELRPTLPWIIHGFRGKREQARQLAAAGLYISFGERFNPEALAAVPASQRLAETDESPHPIADIRAAHERALRDINA
ncbi:MAG: TatD family hydrolase [[Clostridium] fimetarium]|nr:TatD family hydrolase [Alistipes timonensis]MCM1405193.1 TatD family hydrolase [[Clostridium] fimetarium]